ncbi:MAG: hypothetical protein ACRCUT_12690 [Spirochaetota bacterium]
MNSDYAGMALWAVNYAPWAYISYRGYQQGFPSADKEKAKDPVSSRQRADHYFFWYSMCAGNVPLFVDTAARPALARAASFTGKESYLGNSATAVLLSLAGGGGGMFYRGYREWGYFYYQLNNIFVYCTLRSFLGDKRLENDGSYSAVKKDRTKGYIFLSSLCAVKAAEIIHVLASRDKIFAETADSYSLTFLPYARAGETDTSYGLAVNYAF